MTDNRVINIEVHPWTRWGLWLLLLLAGTSAHGQSYRFSFTVEGNHDTVAYIGRHYRDAIQVVDTARRQGDTFVASGRRAWQRGVYALLRQDGRTALTDFVVDDSRRFALRGDSMMSAASIKVKGSTSNAQMYYYLANLTKARAEREALKSQGDNEGLEKLDARMSALEAQTLRKENSNIFFQLVQACENPDVPDSVVDKPRWFRRHYWDAFFETLAAGRIDTAALLHSPQLYNKMNYFFFALLYHAPSDTIISEIDSLTARIGNDTAMRRYVLQFIEPRYLRSTRNIGWDAVWCHLVEHHCLQGQCPWMRESELHVMKKTYQRIRQSIIGAVGQELWMLDTTQIDSPEHWQSSHRRPEKYVILWFWDPDCHHCQEHSAELKTLYDSLCAAGNKRFEVYAVGYESDVEKWRRYVREHEFHWVNVGGTNVNIDYQEAYNVHGAPTMVILDEHRRIIMNKVLPIKNLMGWLDEHERRNNTKD